MNSLTCPPDQHEAYEWQEAHPNAQNCPLSKENLKAKERLEERRFVQLRGFQNTNYGDNDLGYNSWVGE